MLRDALTFLKVATVLTVSSLALMLFMGCNGGSSNSSAAPTSEGTLKIALTDKTNDEFDEVWIKINSVKIVPIGFNDNAADDDPGLIPVPLEPSVQTSSSFNVLELAYVQELLGSVILPAGTYSQVRLILEPNPSSGDPVNYVILKGDATRTKIPLKTPSAQQSGLKVVGQYVVSPGVINAIVLDFDPNTAIVKRGNSPQSEQYILKPTGVRILQMDDVLPAYGLISGNIVPSTWTTATLSVVPQGQTRAIAAGTLFSSYSTAGVVPFTSNVPAGAYRVHIQSAGFLPYSSAWTEVILQNDSPLGTIVLTPTP